MAIRQIIKTGIYDNFHLNITEDFELLEFIRHYKLQTLKDVFSTNKNSLDEDSEDNSFLIYIFWKLLEDDVKAAIDKDNKY